MENDPNAQALLASLLGLGMNDTPGPESDVFDRSGWTLLGTLMDVLEAIDFQHVIFDAHKKRVESTDDGCGAIDAYLEAFPPLVKTAQEVMDEVVALVQERMPELQQAMQAFGFQKLHAMATCPKEDCNDRDDARRELGWTDEEGPTLQ
ncbi:MAG: hypothetical protein ACXABY_02655 [Candidatus Thorarchaeota archaeon]|jgi:hypothetical protein